MYSKLPGGIVNCVQQKAVGNKIDTDWKIWRERWEQEWQHSLWWQSLNLKSYYSNRKGLKEKNNSLVVYLFTPALSPAEDGTAIEADLVLDVLTDWKGLCERREGGNRQNTGWFTGREGLSPLEQLRLSFPASLFTDWQFQMDCLRKQKRLTYFLSCWNLRQTQWNISLFHGHIFDKWL